MGGYAVIDVVHDLPLGIYSDLSMAKEKASQLPGQTMIRKPTERDHMHIDLLMMDEARAEGMRRNGW